MDVEFNSAGVKRLAADLAAAGPKNRVRLSVTLRNAARAIESDAKVLAPVRTGFLKSSISSDVRGLHTEIGPTADYGHYVEHGTSEMAPQPYMRPALERRIPDLRRDVLDVGSDIL